MRIYIILTLLIISLQSYSQNSITISTGFDVKNAFVAGTVNPPGYNGLYRIYNENNNSYIGLSYEIFPMIEFEALGLFYNYKLKTKTLDFCPGVEFKKIHNINSGIEKKVKTIGFNMEIKGKELYIFSWSIITNYTYRKDLANERWLLSNSFNLHCRIK